MEVAYGCNVLDRTPEGAKVCFGAYGLRSREGMRRPEGGDGEGVPSPYKGRGDGIGCSLSLEMKTQDRPLSLGVTWAPP